MRQIYNELEVVISVLIRVGDAEMFEQTATEVDSEAQNPEEESSLTSLQ